MRTGPEPGDGRRPAEARGGTSPGHAAGRSDRARWAVDPDRLVDWVIVLLLLGLTGLSLRFSSLRSDVDSVHTRREPDILLVVLSVAMILPLLWRRSHAIVVLLSTGTVLTVSLLIGFPVTPGQFAVVVAEYSVAAYAGRSEARKALGFTAVAIAASFTLDFRGAETVANVFGVYVIYGTAWLIGDAVRSHRERVAELTARTRAIEAAQAERERNAIRAERVRIARELHDVIAHSMSVMVIHAGAVRRDVAPRDPELAERLRVIETTGRDSLAEMRRVVGALRDTEEPGRPIPAPQPRLEDLPLLIDRFREAGLEIEFEVCSSGRADPDLVVPAVVAMTVYRTVQEALTNVLRHAGPALSRVALSTEDGSVVVDIADDGRGAAARSDGIGNGLLGMRERIQILEGELVAGPRPGGGFRVRARIPLDRPGDAAPIPGGALRDCGEEP